MSLPNDIEQLILAHFQVVPNTKIQGAWAIKHPCGLVEPVRGSYNQVRRTLLSMDSNDVRNAMSRVFRLEGELMAIQQTEREFSPRWLQANKEQFNLFQVDWDLETIKDYLDNK